MHFKLLCRSEENGEARKQLKSRKLSFVDTRARALLRRLGFVREAAAGLDLKSWDVLETALFIESRLPRDANILDIGACNSEILLCLLGMQFKNLVGIDLNEKILSMPEGGNITWRVESFLESSFADSTFDAITAISVLEHGFQQDRLVSELARLLKPGGWLVASVDYWAEKIESDDVLLAGMPWCIFSKSELSAFFAAAEFKGFIPPVPDEWGVPKPVIDWAGKSFTFAWFTMQKALGADARRSSDEDGSRVV